MELTMTNNFVFCELNENEMMMVDGGSWGDAALAFGGIIAISWAPVVALAVPGAGIPIAIAMAAGGIGAIDIVNGGTTIIDY